MDEQKAAILAKIAKLMCLSKDQAGKPEGKLAADMAAKLMAKHMIEESEIDLSDKSADNIFEDEDGWEGLTDQGGKRQWVSDLARSLCNTFSCTYWIDTGKGTIHFIGTISDLETVLYFQDVVYSHIEKEARKELPKASDWKLRNVFGQAAHLEVDSRLRAMKQAMDKEIQDNFQGGSALMVVKDQLVKKTAEDLFKDRGFGKSRRSDVRSSNQRVISAGRKAGQSAPLNRGVGNSGNGQKRLN